MMTILMSYLLFSFTASGVVVLVMSRRATARYHQSAEITNDQKEIGPSGALMLPKTSDDTFGLHQP